MGPDLHRRCVNTIKGLAMDAVQAADSGHPGMPMGTADMATVLWSRFLKFDPTDPTWPDRDRFVLSAGHGSMLLYAMLHLTGYDLTLEDLKQFRQWGSRTPGHPEYGHTPGVETTTGPLGQGFANGVGMAIAERFLRETFGPELCDHYIYAIVSDGDLMEGVAHEAASIAGHLGLGRLVYLYDDNEITIDGRTSLSFSEDRVAGLAAAGWHVQRVNGHDAEAIASAIEAARAVTDKPSLIACRTVIGQGSTIEGTSKTHGAALGVEEVKRTKVRLGLDPDATFVVPEEVRSAFRAHDGPAARRAWEQRLAAHPDADKFRSWYAAKGSDASARVAWPAFETGKQVATRKASQACLKAIYAVAPWLVGGSADLAGSNGTELGAKSFSRESFANAGTLHFGVREHGMGAICNGMALHGGARPYNATFLEFHDYQRPAVRLSALMGLPVTWVYSHDSVFLGEDGPTHQPVATMLALRALPGVRVWRPGDAIETVEAWKACLARDDGPSAIILTRQNLPTLDRSAAPAHLAQRGGYVIRDAAGTPDVVLLATGSEVPLCVAAAERLAAQGVAARVVSLPCRELFLEQDADWRESVLPTGIPRLSVEAAITLGWERWLGAEGEAFGIDTYGWSAPAEVIAEKIGFTPDGVAERARALLTRARR